MNWKELFPEGSTIFVGGVPYLARHNPYFDGVDLYWLDELVMTIAPRYLPQIASGVKYPD